MFGVWGATTAGLPTPPATNAPACAPFRGNTMWAVVGRCPREYRETYDFHNPVYTVCSYGTPIAWVVNDHVGTIVVPEVKYSTTTSRHQGLCRAWL